MRRIFWLCLACSVLSGCGIAGLGDLMRPGGCGETRDPAVIETVPRGAVCPVMPFNPRRTAVPTIMRRLEP